MKRFAVALIALVCSRALGAHETPPAEPWPRQELGTYVSEPGEALPAFVRRVGRVVFEFTKQSGHEACGSLGKSGDRYATILGSDGVQNGCLVRRSRLPERFVHTGESIHSHPVQEGSLRLTERDLAWWKAQGLSRPDRTFTRKPGFSRSDFQGGPGWLIEGVVVLHQDGLGRVRRHGVIAPRWEPPGDVLE